MIFNVGQGGGSSKLVHLNISYDTSLAGANITATNGTEVLTAVANESGLTVISGRALGTWTITCDDITKTVDTTFYGNYDTVLESGSTLNLTVLSTSNDTVYYYPNNDTSKTPVTLCTTDNTGTGSGTITVSIGSEITFYSTVAKDTTDGTSAYSKNITLSDSTTEIKLMPDSALYWYGNECSDITGGWNITNFNNATISGGSDLVLNKDTTSLYLQNTTSKTVNYIIKKGFSTQNLIDMTPYNKVHILLEPNPSEVNSYYKFVVANSLTDTKTDNNISGAVKTSAYYYAHIKTQEFDISDVNQSLYSVLLAMKGSNWQAYVAQVKQIWLE